MDDPYVTAKVCNERHAEIMGAIKKLDDKLYRDNGNKSVQSILNEHGAVIKALLWVVGVITIAVIAALAKLLIFGGDRIIVETL